MENNNGTPVKVTRKVLRGMKKGDALTVQCKDYYNMDSQKNLAYQMRRLEGKAFKCHAEGLTLTVTCLGTQTGK